MAKPSEVRCYEYVNRPYDSVRKVLSADPLGLFQRATTVAEARAQSLVSKLKVSIAGVEVAKDVTIEIVGRDETRTPPHDLAAPATALDISWRAASGAGFFPSMRAELFVYPLSADETQLDLHGWYTPPGGLLGSAANALVGRRLAEASVHRFLEEIVEQLRAETITPP